MRFGIVVLIALLCGCGGGVKKHVVARPKTPQPVIEESVSAPPAPEPTLKEKLQARFEDVIARHRKTAGDDTEKELLALFDDYPTSFNDYIKTLSEDARTISVKLASSETVYKKVLLLPAQKPKTGKLVIQTEGGLKIVVKTDNISSIWFSGFPSSE